MSVGPDSKGSHKIVEVRRQTSPIRFAHVHVNSACSTTAPQGFGGIGFAFALQALREEMDEEMVGWLVEEMRLNRTAAIAKKNSWHRPSPLRGSGLSGHHHSPPISPNHCAALLRAQPRAKRLVALCASACGTHPNFLSYSSVASGVGTEKVSHRQGRRVVEWAWPMHLGALSSACVRERYQQQG